MHAIDLLLREHQTVHLVMDALEESLRAVRLGERARPGFFRRTAEFFRDHVDGAHNAKELELFAALRQVQPPLDGELLTQQIREHTLGIELALELADAADAGDSERLLRIGQQYVKLQQRHCQVEEELLFPAARARLPEPKLAHLAQRFSLIDQGQRPMEEVAAPLLDAGPPCSHPPVGR